MGKQHVSDLALVTGASSGIGKAFAVALAERGSGLVLVARDAERLEALAADLRARGNVTVEVLPADLEDRGQLARVEAKLREDRRIDLLINNAGYGWTGPFADAPVEKAQGQIDCNVTALTRLARAALGRMKSEGRGGVINVASGAAFLPTPRLAVYAATKAYVVSLTQGIAEELKGTPVRATVVCPGFTRTEFQERAAYDTSALPSMVWQTAEAVVEETLASYLAGSVICVPGIQNKVMMTLIGLLPRSVVPSIISRFS